MNIVPRKQLKLNLTFAIVIFCLPLLLYAYALFPEKNQIEICGYILKVEAYKNLRLLSYYLLLRIYVITFLSLWFLSIIETWRYILFLSIIYNYIRLFAVLNREFDLNDNTYCIGGIVGVSSCLILYFTQRRLENYNIDEYNLVDYDIIKLIYRSHLNEIIYKKKNDSHQGLINRDDVNKESLKVKISNLEIL